MSTHAVKVSEDVMEDLRDTAALQNRSIAGQAEYWMRLGRAVERDPRLSFALVEQALRGLVPPAQLSGDQQEEYLDRLEDMQDAPSAAEEAFFADRRRRGVGVGMDDAGLIVRQAANVKLS